MGTSLLGLGRYADAEPLLVGNLAKFRKVFGDSSYLTQSLAARIVDLYERWGRRDKAAEYRRLSRTFPPRGGARQLQAVGRSRR
jgi:hypothetical protein